LPHFSFEKQYRHESNRELTPVPHDFGTVLSVAQRVQRGESDHFRKRAMEKNTSSNGSPDSRSAQRTPKDPRRHGKVARQSAAKSGPDALSTHFDFSSALDRHGATLKPLLLGVGIGAALAGVALLLRPKHEKGGLTLGGPNAELAGKLTKSALLAFARVVSGDSLRSAATRALVEAAETWKS
jgi:hypothetical protein